MSSEPTSLGHIHTTLIGGGAGAAMVLMQWILQGNIPKTILWCESEATDGQDFGLGAAYRTTHPRHLLNVMASRMGCFPDKPDDFQRWVEQSDLPDAIAARQGDVPLAEAYLPRRLYGQYLQSRLRALTAQLAPGQLILFPHRITAILPEATGGYRIESAAGHWQSTQLVLAMGNQPNTRWPAARNAPGWIGNIWQKDMRALPPAEGNPLLVLGAGLSAVDTVLSLRDAGWKDEIRLVSRHGHWPQPHLLKPITPHAHRFEDMRNLRPAALLGYARRLVRSGVEWRAVVDGLRPHTIALWQGWDAQDQKRFLHRLWPWWNIHRHRMAPPAQAWLDTALPGPSRMPLPAYIAEIENDHAQLKAHLRSAEGTMILPAAAIADCTGPSLSVLANPGPMHHLLQAGFVAPCANGAGLETDFQHRAYAGKHGTIFALGTLTLGQRLETTAIPELRQQAAELATV